MKVMSELEIVEIDGQAMPAGKVRKLRVSRHPQLRHAAVITFPDDKSVTVAASFLHLATRFIVEAIAGEDE